MAFLNNSSPLVGNSGSGLVGNSGSSLVGNSGSAYRVQSRRTTAIEGQTNAAGWFVITPPSSGTYNVQAVKSDASKAWKSSVSWNGAVDASAGNLKLAPTGTLTGRIKSTVGSVTDFSNTFVFIPGSNYVGTTRSDGTYTFVNMPAASFEMGAYNVDLGDARLPNDDNPSLVKVDSNLTTTAPAMYLKVVPPVLSFVSRPGGEKTDNGAVGTVLELHGDGLGYRRGAKFEVRFAAATAVLTERAGEDLIRVKVPVSALNGQILVLVGNTLSNPLDFRVMKRMDMGVASVLSLRVGDLFDLGGALQAYDTDDVRITEFKDGETVLKYRPNVSFSADSARAGVTQRGALTALSVGNVTVTGTAGDLIRTSTITITNSTGATPAPTATPGPTPSPAPSASPTGLVATQVLVSAAKNPGRSSCPGKASGRTCFLRRSSCQPP